MSGYARLLKEVFADDAAAEEAAARAENVRAAILAKTVVPGPFGLQFVEGVNRHGKIPQMKSDGEESDTTLIPFYGFLHSDDARYGNYMRFSMSTNNAQYVAATHSINWEKVPATAPGYNKGLCAGASAESLFGAQGYFTEIRRVTDVDGSVWWWPRRINQQNEVEIRRTPGKSGWFAGVFDAVFVNRFLGVAYDAPTRTLWFAPLPATGDFIWSNFPIGLDRFTVSYQHGVASVINLNRHSVTVIFDRTSPVTVPPGKSASEKTL
jgi:hypothetical protein